MTKKELNERIEALEKAAGIAPEKEQHYLIYTLNGVEVSRQEIDCDVDIIYEGQGVHRGFKFDGESKNNDDVMEDIF